MPVKMSSLPSRTIQVGEGELIVRGFGFTDIAQLVDANRELLSPFFDRLTGKNAKQKLTMDNIGQVPAILIATMPSVVVHAIALAADVTDEPEVIAWLAKLPLDIQLLAIEAIVELSVKTAGGARPFIEMLTAMMASVGDLGKDVESQVAQATQRLTNGSTA